MSDVKYKTKVVIVEQYEFQNQQKIFQPGTEVLLLGSNGRQYLVGSLTNPKEEKTWVYKAQVDIQVVPA